MNVDDFGGRKFVFAMFVVLCAFLLVISGQISFCVMARADTNEHGRLVASSIGIAVPRDKKQWGYLSEVHGHGMNSSQAGDMAEDLAAGMLGTTLAVAFVTRLK